MRPIALAAILLVCAFVSACTDNVLTTNEEDYSHVIGVVRKPAVMKVTVEGTGLISEGQDAAIKTFMDSWRDRSKGELSVAVPQDMAAFSETITEQLYEIATSRGAVRSISIYEAPADQEANVVTLTYDDYVAVAPECGGDGLDLYGTKNRPMRSFGCATQNNLARMIANPIDLVEPQVDEPGTNASKRTITIQNTRDGKASPWITTPSAGTSVSTSTK